MRKRRSDSGTATIEIIFQCLEEVANEEGLDGLSMREVARRAEIALASLQRYFPTKASLLSAFVDRSVEKYKERVSRLQEGGGTKDTFETIVRFAAQETLSISNGGILSMIESRIDRDEVCKQCFRSLMSSYLSLLIEAIARSFPELNENDVQRSAIVICSFLEGLPTAVFAAQTFNFTADSVVNDVVSQAIQVPALISFKSGQA